MRYKVRLKRLSWGIWDKVEKKYFGSSVTRRGLILFSKRKDALDFCEKLNLENNAK